jgi:hypothetical protein
MQQCRVEEGVMQMLFRRIKDVAKALQETKPVVIA